jgi:hypothetical protein
MSNGLDAGQTLTALPSTPAPTRSPTSRSVQPPEEADEVIDVTPLFAG